MSLFRRVLLMSLSSAVLIACADDTPVDELDASDGSGQAVPTAYVFESRFEAEVSSVSYDGQVMRQLLVSSLGAAIEGMTEDIDAGRFQPAADGDVVAALDYYYRFDSDSYGEELFSFSVSTLQAAWNDVSTGKDLVGKTAGNDATTDHRDWSTEFVGWSNAEIADFGGSIFAPETFVVALFETLEERAIARANGVTDTAPDGTVLPVHVTPEGIDLAELAEKFLAMAVFFSQATDDYLDDATEGKGLLSANTQDEGAPWTVLEHQWDEGFGYFGAARDFAERTPAEVAASPGLDVDGDGLIDLQREFNFAHARYAAQRDRDSVEPTTFSADIAAGFLGGRSLIANAGDALTVEELSQLQMFRDQAVSAWEAATGATIVHYLNDVLEQTSYMGSEAYDFAEHGKAWSEMKGFALGLQFNPRSPMLADFARLHELLADAPVLESEGVEDVQAYAAGLREARTLLGQNYGFATANLGDDSGLGGW
jgi:hypothetical protein